MYTNFQLFEYIQVISRLGSPSSEAEVYYVKLINPKTNLETSAALKVMPRKSFEDIEKNEREIRNAILAEEYCGSPKVYASGYCKNVRLYPQSPHEFKAKEFSKKTS